MHDIARTLALGADWCNAARGYMFALGCIQSLSCHTDRCPTGVIRRISSTEVRSLSVLLRFMQPGELLHGQVPEHPVFQAFWSEARSDSFAAPAKVRAIRSSKIR